MGTKQIAMRSHLRKTIESNMPQLLQQSYGLTALTKKMGTWSDDEWDDFMSPEVLKKAKLDMRSRRFCRMITSEWRLSRNELMKEIRELIANPNSHYNVFLMHEYHVLWDKAESKKCVLCWLFGICNLNDPEILKTEYARITRQIPMHQSLRPQISALSLSNGAGSSDTHEVYNICRISLKLKRM